MPRWLQSIGRWYFHRTPFKSQLHVYIPLSSMAGSLPTGPIGSVVTVVLWYSYYDDVTTHSSLMNAMKSSHTVKEWKSIPTWSKANSYVCRSFSLQPRIQYRENVCDHGDNLWPSFRHTCTSEAWLLSAWHRWCSTSIGQCWEQTSDSVETTWGVGGKRFSF